MTLGLDDPRVAQLLTDMVDRRVRAAIDGMARIRYGTVAAVDKPSSTASLLLGGSLTPSPGFVYEGSNVPVVGDRVRAVNRGADRYIEAILSGPTANSFPAWSGREVYLSSNHAVVTSTWTKPTGWVDGRYRQPGSEYGLSSSAIVVPYDGLYLVNLACDWVVNATGSRALGVGTGTVSPSNTDRQTRAASFGTPGILMRVTNVEPRLAGETIALWAWHNLGSNLSVVGGANTTSMSVIYLGPNV